MADLCEIIAVLQQSEGSEELAPRPKARLVIKGIQMLRPMYAPGKEPEHAAMQYLLGQAEKYRNDPETKDIIEKGLPKSPATP